MSERIKGFAPFFTAQSKVLILGSFPSVKSREQAFYYGNKQNAFWRIIANFFDEELPQTVESKKQLLLKHNLALWDIVTECEIVGSSDASIKNFTVANIGSLLQNSAVECILINGGKAYELFIKHFKDIGVRYVKLPSTSPANTNKKDDIWYDALTTAFRRT